MPSATSYANLASLNRDLVTTTQLPNKSSFESSSRSCFVFVASSLNLSPSNGRQPHLMSKIYVGQPLGGNNNTFPDLFSRLDYFSDGFI